jgi:hypothetical protein
MQHPAVIYTYYQSTMQHSAILRRTGDQDSTAYQSRASTFDETGRVLPDQRVLDDELLFNDR